MAKIQVDVFPMKPGRIYKWSMGATFKVDAQTAGERIELLQQQHGGVVNPDDVVEDARNPESPLHHEFIWDVEEAAKRHWRSRARQLLNHIVIVDVETSSASEGVHAFHSVDVTTTKRGYVSVDAVVSNEDFRQQTIKRVLKMLKGLQRRFSYLSELGEIWAVIDAAEVDRASDKDDGD